MNLDRAERSQFREIAPGQFRYVAATDFFYRTDEDGWGEQQRLRWLDANLDLNALCAKGYQLTSRRVMFRYASPLGYPVNDIEYEGRCLP